MSEIEIQTGGDLIAMPENPVALFTDDHEYSIFYAKVKAATEGHVADVTTATGRDAVKSLAFKVTKAKTKLDKLALRLTEDWRNQTALVNASRKKMVSDLEALAADVRKPVTEWEQAEDRRRDQVDAVLKMFRDDGIVTPEDTAETVKARGLVVWNSELDLVMFADRLDEAQATKDATVAALRAAHQRLTKEEADAAELAVLRAEREAREAREAEEAAAKAEAERVATAAAEEKAKQEAAAAAQAAAIQKAKDDAAAEAIAAERKAAEEAAAEAQRANDAALKAAAAELEAAKAKAAEIAKGIADAAALKEHNDREDAKRAANRAHVSGVMTKAKEAIMRCGITEEQARVIVLAIKAGEIPAVSIAF